jgi:glycosyltransferase involved in cell wall biosynthesis
MISFSVITTSRNSSGTIKCAIDSVRAQTKESIEYIIVDGESIDRTVDIVKSYGSQISSFVSEPDAGIYDAINKGIRMATGEIVGVLHSDDFFYDDMVLERVAEAFADENVDAVFGDVRFVKPDNLNKTVRYYSSAGFNISKFKSGQMPAHPSFYARRELFEKLGYYKTDYKIAADFELLLRFMHVHKINFKYLNMPFVTMRTGGASTKSLLSNITINREIMRACRENGVHTNYLRIYSKYFHKVFQLFGSRR